MYKGQFKKILIVWAYKLFFLKMNFNTIIKDYSTAQPNQISNLKMLDKKLSSKSCIKIDNI